MRRRGVYGLSGGPYEHEQKARAALQKAATRIGSAMSMRGVVGAAAEVGAAYAHIDEIPNRATARSLRIMADRLHAEVSGFAESVCGGGRRR